MKKIIIGLLALTLTTGAIAQGHKNHPNKNHKNKDNKEWKQNGKEKMNDLDLSNDQQRQMKTVNESFKSKMQALNQDKTISAESRKQRRSEILNERRRQMDAILTPDQRKQWQENKEDWRADKEDRKEDKKEWKDARKEDKKDWKEDKKDWKEDRKEYKKSGREDRGDDDRDEARPGRDNRGRDIINQLDLSPEQTARYKELNQQHQLAVQNVRKNTNLTEDQKNEQIQQLRLKQRQATESLLTREQKEKMRNFQKQRRGKGANRMTK